MVATKVLEGNGSTMNLVIPQILSLENTLLNYRDDNTNPEVGIKLADVLLTNIFSRFPKVGDGCTLACSKKI